MKHISILVPSGAPAISTIEGTFGGFMTANDLLIKSGREPLFTVQFVGMTTEPQVYHRVFTLRPDVTFNEVEKTDLIIIPAVNGNMEEVIEMNKGFFPWINFQYRNGAEVASMCVGTFLLAATGLLKGKKCSTHWLAHNEFRRMFPDVTLVPDRIITDEQGIYSSGGASSFWNLVLYLIEKYAGRDIAISCAKIYAVEINRDSQSPFIIFSGEKAHDDEPVKYVQSFIENNFGKKISVDQLATLTALGRRNLERRFKKATSNTVVEYIQRVKIEAAKKSLETSGENISEVMYSVGYTDSKAFRNIFKKVTGVSPVEYRNRYKMA
jgi:transcriptional regulator GlxA family with amidase domain